MIARRGLIEDYIDANGNRATRYFVHPRVLVGGSIMGPDDWAHLQRDLGVTSVISVQSQPSDEHTYIDAQQLFRRPFLDDGARIPRDDLGRMHAEHCTTDRVGDRWAARAAERAVDVQNVERIDDEVLRRALDVLRETTR